MSDPLLVVDRLSVRFGKAAPVVDDITFDIAAGECLALVGESGSGKSVAARTLIGLAGSGSRVSARRLEFSGADLTRLSARSWRRIRGAKIGFVLQDALVSLDPLRPVGREIDDALRLHTSLTPVSRRQRVVELLREVGIPDPDACAGRRADELSGGMRQRALIASAIALSPDLVVADEPTTALDVGVQAHILELLDALRHRGTAVLLISHDLSVVERFADRTAVMHAGRIVETANTGELLDAPRTEYARALLAAIPGRVPRGQRLTTSGRLSNPAGAERAPLRAEPSLVLDRVTKRYRKGRHDEFVAVDSVSLSLRAGETLGLVGESGSGKTTTGRIALGLTRPESGTVTMAGELWNPAGERRRRPRRRELAAIYQDPFSSFDPRLTVGNILADALSGGTSTRVGARRDELAELLHSVGLDAALLSRRTHALSGGQRQRVAIARALAPRPRVLICDEPVSSLDVSVQAQVLDLLDETQGRLGIGYLFISHDLGVIRHCSDRVAVMTAGRIVETGPTEQVFGDPQHPYTRALLSASSVVG